MVIFTHFAKPIPSSVILFRDEHPMLACLGWCSHGPLSTWEDDPASSACENAPSAPARGPGFAPATPSGHSNPAADYRGHDGRGQPRVSRGVSRGVSHGLTRGLAPAMASPCMRLWPATGPG
jgi:hypothetical protein